MNIHDFLGRLDGVTGNEGKWTAHCPCSQNHSHRDRNRSLSISVGNDERILIYCHKGCTATDITAALGLTLSDLFPKKEFTAPVIKKEINSRTLDKLYPKLGNIAAQYDYFDASGILLAKKLRYQLPDGNKTFRWCRPDGQGKWLTGRGNIPHRLFVAGKLEDFLYIVEGEKDALTMQKFGCNACSAADGAGGISKWRDEYTEQLRNEGHDIKGILIIQDNDTTGQDFAQETATAVSAIGIKIKVLDLSLVWPEIPDKGDVSDMVTALGAERAYELLFDLESQTPLWQQEEADMKFSRDAQRADSFGPDMTRFLWSPYLPIGDYSVIMADGGTGKTILCCGIAAAVSTGSPLPGELSVQGEGKDVLIISGEDSGEVLKKRLELSGADTKRIYILDRSKSIGMNLTTGYREFIATVRRFHPALLIIDPWHNFLGVEVDIFRVNALRPILQKVADMAKQCNCAIIMVSHVNKRAQGENANNAATGSVDFINASRSAMRLIFDESDKNSRILVHTKSNYAIYGRSVCFQIEDGGLVWNGFSDITRETLEEAARSHSTPYQVSLNQEEQKQVNTALIQALKAEADIAFPKPVRFSYEEFKGIHGEQIFGEFQPKRALDAVESDFSNAGYLLKTGTRVIHGQYNGNGFLIQKLDIQK